MSRTCNPYNEKMLFFFQSAWTFSVVTWKFAVVISQLLCMLLQHNGNFEMSFIWLNFHIFTLFLRKLCVACVWWKTFHYLHMLCSGFDTRFKQQRLQSHYSCLQFISLCLRLVMFSLSVVQQLATFRHEFVYRGLWNNFSRRIYRIK